MSSLRKQWAIVPRAAKIAAAFGYIALVSFLYLVPFRHDDSMAEWPAVGLIAFILLMPLVIPIWLHTVGYVYADAKRRGMRHVMWTMLALFIPNGIGIILYFMMREPLPVTCGRCGASEPGAFAFCPRCGTSLTSACPACNKPAKPGWSHCAYCGAALQAANASS